MVRRLLWLMIIVTFGQSMGPHAAIAASTRTSLFPNLHAGQTFTYLIQYRSKKNVKTESRVFTPLGPQNDQMDSQWLLHVEILGVQPQGTRAVIHARSQFQSVDAAPPSNSNDKSTDKPRAPGAESKPVEFTINSDGRADAVKGLDLLFPEQRQVWQQWLRQFAIAAVFPREGVKRGENWKSTEIEEAPSPIAKLQWEKSESYVRDEPCFPVQISDAGVATPKNSQHETCAVVLTHAVLKQKSSPKDTTPVDYKLHALHTSGTASGTNETISYIDLQSGLVVRVTEDAKQFMDVVIAKADESNKIHYNVNATSRTEILLVAPSAPSKP